MSAGTRTNQYDSRFYDIHNATYCDLVFENGFLLGRAETLALTLALSAGVECGVKTTALNDHGDRGTPTPAPP